MATFFAEKMQDKKFRLLFTGLALVLAILYDVLLWKHQAGLGVVLYTVLYLSAFTVLLSITDQLREKMAFLLFLPILVLNIDILLYHNGLVSFFVPFLLFVILFLFSVLATLQNPNQYEFFFFSIPIVGHLLLPSVMLRIEDVFKDFSWGQDNSDRYKKILKGVLVSLPLLFVFVLLFSSADAVFGRWLEDIPKLVDKVVLWRVVRTVLITVLFAGFFYALICKDNIMGQKRLAVEKFDNAVVSTILVLLNILFGVFVFIQFKYLFGGANFVLKNGIVFSEYAKKGFYELVAAVILSGLIMLIVHRFVAHHGAPKFITFLQVLFVAQTAVMAVSALERMNLYQEAYGFTVQRLYVEWFIYFVLAVSALAIVGILFKFKFKNLMYGGLAFGLTALVAVASINIDYTIAAKNISRYVDSGKELDIEYLQRLSVDIAPALADLNTEKAYARLATSTDTVMQLRKLIGEKKSYFTSKKTLEWQVTNAKLQADIANVSSSFDSVYAKIIKTALDEQRRKEESINVRSKIEAMMRADEQKKANKICVNCAVAKIGNKEYVLVLLNYARGSSVEIRNPVFDSKGKIVNYNAKAGALFLGSGDYNLLTNGVITKLIYYDNHSQYYWEAYSVILRNNAFDISFYTP